MLKRIFFVVVTVLLLVNAANAMIGLGQGYSIGAINGLGVDGQGVATGGSAISVDNTQTATSGWQFAVEEQAGILVQGGTAIGTSGSSSAYVVQCAGADSLQGILVTDGVIVGGQETDLYMGQMVYADDGAAAYAGQGAILGNGQLGANQDSVAGNASVVGAINTSSAVAGPGSDATSGSAVTVETVQGTLVL